MNSHSMALILSISGVFLGISIGIFLNNLIRKSKENPKVQEHIELLSKGESMTMGSKHINEENEEIIIIDKKSMDAFLKSIEERNEKD